MQTYIKTSCRDFLHLKYGQCPCLATEHRKALDRKAPSSVCGSGRKGILKTQRSSQNLRNDITAVGIFPLHQKESLGHKEHFVQQPYRKNVFKNFMQLQVTAFISLLDIVKCVLSFSLNTS